MRFRPNLMRTMLWFRIKTRRFRPKKPSPAKQTRIARAQIEYSNRRIQSSEAFLRDVQERYGVTGLTQIREKVLINESPLRKKGASNELLSQVHQQRRIIASARVRLAAAKEELKRLKSV